MDQVRVKINWESLRVHSDLNVIKINFENWIIPWKQLSKLSYKIKTSMTIVNSNINNIRENR